MKRLELGVKLQVIAFALLLSACGEGFRANITESEMMSAGSHNACFRDLNTQACVFRKNPLVEAGGEAFLSPIAGQSDLSAYQSYGVGLSGLDASGYLQNASLTIQTGQGERAQAAEGYWKFAFKDDASAKAVQVHTYYWLNRTIEEMIQRAGNIYVNNKLIQVVVNAATTGWTPVQNAIFLERSNSGNQAALDAGLSVHLLGQANLFHATNGLIDDLGLDTSHGDCGLSGGAVFENDCCTTVNGCSRALASGQADYLVALMFPENPTVGETWVNRSSGFRYCNMSRDLRRHANTTAAQAFAACTPFGASGQIYNMGTLYASIWFEIRKKLSADLPERLKDFDRLYMLHLAQLAGHDNFTTALSKIKQIDAAAFSMTFKPFFEDEYTRRGLALTP